jgi:tetratricopeptide (TPR) repeat protein
VGRLLEFWNSLSQEVRNGIISTIIGGVGLGIITLAFKLSGKSISAAFRRLFHRAPVPELLPPPSTLPPTQHEVIIKVEQPTPPRTEEPKPAPPPAASHGNLPRPTKVPFVARHDQNGNDILARLQEELSPEKNQLVALWGDGGLGKTALAVEAARALIGTLIHRLAWTSADGRPDYSLSTLLDEIAEHLGETELRKLALEPKKEAVHALIAADSATLIVLDNFETIAPEEQQRCAEWIAHHAPCPALITTRERVSDARNIPLGRMSEPEANEFLDKLIAQSPSPKTFAGVERQRIIQAAGANPLVMQWVIAQIELAQHPNDVLNDLARGEGTAAQRVFDRSFNLPQVGDDGRDALLALSLFVPDASREALAEVAGFGDDMKRLREAVKHLAALRLVERTEASERLILRGLTRSLAKARLSNDACADEFRRRFVAYFLRYAESYSQTTPEDLAALETERDSVLGAMDEALGIRDWQSVMQIMAVIGRPADGFLSLHGYWDEAIQRGKQTVQAAQAINNEHEIAVFSMNIATMLYLRGEFDEAAKLYQQALEVFKKLESETNIAGVLHQLAMIAQDQGKIEEARRLYNDSLEITKRLGDQSGIAITLHELGRLAQAQGEIEEARRLHNDSLEIKKRLGDQSGIAMTLHQLALLAQDQGEIEEARRLYNDSLEIVKRLGNQSGIAITLHQLGRIAEHEGNLVEAARLFREALSIFEKLQSPNAAIARRSLERVQGKA